MQSSSMLRQSGSSVRPQRQFSVACSPRVARHSRGALVCEAVSKAKFLVGGNWKCNGTRASVKELINGLNEGASSICDNVDVVVCPTYVHLDFVQSMIHPKFKVGAQNCSLTGNGAFTGEVSDEIIKDLGLDWVITGHSERRSLFNETNQQVAKKTARALEYGFNVIACIGETLDQRNTGEMWPVLDGQVQALIDHVKDWDKVAIAYEPVWAIGTGVVATPEQAQEVHLHLREQFEKKLGVAVASKLRLMYGGSVNDKNCGDLACQPDIDGFLVGGASLQAKPFLTIVHSHLVSDKAK